MRRPFCTLAAVAVLMLWSPLAARAQTADVLDSCAPTAYLTAGKPGRLTVNKQGQLCGIVAATIDTTGLATSTNQASQITQETAINTLLGLQADSACATDNGTCTLAALVKRLNQRQTTLNTTLGSPFQAGGSIGNTAFGATLPATPLIASGNGVVDTPTSEASAGVTTTASSALAANLVVNAAATNLHGFNVSADSTLSGAAWWIMIYNATSAPVDGAITPAKCYAMPSGTTSFSAAWPKPVRFTTGVTIGVSTTGCFTKTASTHAFISGDYK